MNATLSTRLPIGSTKTEDVTPSAPWTPTAATWKTEDQWKTEDRSLATGVLEERRTRRDTTDAIIRSLYEERRRALRALRTTPEHGESRDRLKTYAEDLERSIHDLQLRELAEQPKSDVWDKMDRLATRLLALDEKLESSAK